MSALNPFSQMSDELEVPFIAGYQIDSDQGPLDSRL